MKKKLLHIILILSFFALPSCIADLEELNINPNEPQSTDVNYLFTYSLKHGMGGYNVDVTLEQWGIMRWMMYLANRGGVEPGKEYEMPGGKDGFWNEQYADALANCQEIINLSEEDPSMINVTSIAMIWKVYLFSRITDLWGDIPYSEALKGNSELHYSPKYDLQKDIYPDLLSTLKTAAESLTTDLATFKPEADLIYNGDVTKWRAFANALRLRLATRISAINPELYRSELAELQQEILFSSNEDNALFPFNNVFKNHLYEADFRGEAVTQNNPSQFFVDLMKETNDPRISILLEKAPLSILPIYEEYNGVPNLVYTNDPIWDDYDEDWGDISKIGSWFLRDETPGVIMTYSEVCFLISEAILKGHWNGNLTDIFNEGIQAHIDLLIQYGEADDEILEVEITNYLNAFNVIDLEEIITQKYILFAFENGYEAYSEFRRTGFPMLLKQDNSQIDLSSFPKRLIYPSSEITLNRENYMEAISNLGGEDSPNQEVWWDLN